MFTFLVPLSTISEIGSTVLDDRISFETSFPSTVNTLYTSIFFPNLPCCFILVVPSVNSELFSITRLYAKLVSIVLSSYNNSGLVNFPDITSSSGLTVLTPLGLTWTSLFFLTLSNCLSFLIYSSFFFSKSLKFFKESNFLSLLTICCLFCCFSTLLILSAFSVKLFSNSFFINPTKLYPGIEEILGSLSPTFKL